ncbi:hypothetical protein AB3M75_19980 [Serratia ureilytica]|uniref:transcriptional antitermination N peptide n=1 Tax=Serratia ureilytica TaxID=300181 RepID=UPI0037171E6B
MKCYSYDNADKRRRDRRKALREAYNREHDIPGVAEQSVRPVLTLNRNKPVDRVQKAVNPISFDYRAQITSKADELYAIAMKGRVVVEGPTCLPEVAKYAAGHRKVRKEATHIVK